VVFVGPLTVRVCAPARHAPVLRLCSSTQLSVDALLFDLPAGKQAVSFNDK